MIDRATELFGYFQSEKYFAHCADEVRHYFTPHHAISELLEKGFGDLLAGKTCSVHVRRTDYVDNPMWTDLSADDYYERAMAQFDSDSTFVIFSDDIEWCQDAVPWTLDLLCRSAERRRGSLPDVAMPRTHHREFQLFMVGRMARPQPGQESDRAVAMVYRKVREPVYPLPISIRPPGWIPRHPRSDSARLDQNLIIARPVAKMPLVRAGRQHMPICSKVGRGVVPDRPACAGRSVQRRLACS